MPDVRNMAYLPEAKQEAASLVLVDGDIHL
ncbi:hypothetical protein HALO59_160177 [Halomonas sp. 59]|nr:hypothetical protein HALO113_160819 [Halomonas sp. 113]CAD5265679.1 hypothetical protein HALO59_160177 [Halomonas sp. 59]CAD5284533.1 hypothetical protein HALO156_30014 [Halomonas sp. 156]VXB55171.1 hypothetical protein HALO98_170177 [Halomonas titanicae]VXC53380.1 hypothetical protein HALO153_330440 [Halomonas titanicae]